MIRKKLHNRVQDLLGRVRVFCRIRPPKEQLERDGSFPCDYNCSLEDGAGVTRFTFDGVFASHATQADVFEDVNPLITSCMDGYDVTIFAYGQTGSGKTYTMFGRQNEEDRGVVPRSVEQIFEIIKEANSKQWVYTLSVSILEIYNESIRDLLAKVRGQSGSHEIKTDKTGKVHVTNLTQRKVDANDPRQLHALTRQAAEQATRESTDMNSNSSRSHTLFRLHIEGRNKLSKQTVSSVLSLVDLAGSERVSKSNCKGDRFEEAKNINSSLSSLGNQFRWACRNNAHVPYRNSKLTYLLHSALAGSGKTAFLVNISPEAASAGESICTLRFAEYLKRVKCV
eukprot:jgi/Bigna1/34725/e_gw1.6.204.1